MYANFTDIFMEAQELVSTSENPKLLSGLLESFKKFSIGEIKPMAFYRNIIIFFRETYQENDASTLSEKFDQLSVEAEDVRTGLGQYALAEVMTGQEHLLLGSSAGNYDEPYMPRILLREGVALQKVRESRERIKTFPAFGHYFGFEKKEDEFGFISATLEPLDDIGRTIRDPRPVYAGEVLEDRIIVPPFPFIRG